MIIFMLWPFPSQESIPVGCQPPACQPYMLYIKQVWTCSGRGQWGQWGPHVDRMTERQTWLTTLPFRIFVGGGIWRQNERNDIRIFVNQQHVIMMSSLNFYTWGKVKAILWLHNNKAATSKIYIQQKFIALIYINFNILWYLLYLHTSSLEIKVKMCKRYTVHLIYLNLSVLHCWILLRITWIELRQQNTYTDFDFEFLRCFLDISFEMKYWISVEYWRCFLNSAPIFVFVGK